MLLLANAPRLSVTFLTPVNVFCNSDTVEESALVLTVPSIPFTWFCNSVTVEESALVLTVSSIPLTFSCNSDTVEESALASITGFIISSVDS